MRAPACATTNQHRDVLSTSATAHNSDDGAAITATPSREEAQARLSPTAFVPLSASCRGANGYDAGVAVPVVDLDGHFGGTAVRSGIANPRAAAVRSGLAIPQTAHGDDVDGNNSYFEGSDNGGGVWAWAFPEESQAQQSTVSHPGVPGRARRPPVTIVAAEFDRAMNGRASPAM